jgi:hypothetical protein
MMKKQNVLGGLFVKNFEKYAAEFLKKYFPLLRKYNKAQLLLAKAPVLKAGVFNFKILFELYLPTCCYIAMNRSFFVTAFIFPLLLLSQKGRRSYKME